MERPMPTPSLFTPIALRGITLRNRVVLSPMCTYSARDGIADDFHLVHLGKFALGGFGLIFFEATAVHERGRITHGDLGLWHDGQIAPLRRITDFLREHGAVPAIQLAHAGRKASMQRPWKGNGPLGKNDFEAGDLPWPVVAPSALALDEGWLVPHQLSATEMDSLKEDWRTAALRALDAGFDVAEVHGAHGYLLHEFLSPISNRRDDAYGGDLAGRMRFPLEVAETVRAVWPADRPLFFRISAVDGIDGGWTLDDSVVLARELKQRGVDVIDCSSGGLLGSATAARIPRGPGFQLPFSERIRRDADVATMAVGLILTARQAEDALNDGAADLVAIGREALFDPNWPLHAEQALAPEQTFRSWPEQYGWWLERRARGMAKV
jgi:2,4-dienoyl-CoA reductase-like NADH-dependent reductase (Old Yellow Enzyme family)